MKNKKRTVELAVLSDIHLGTYGCHAKELLKYMKSIKPTTVVLNGDIIDIWQFKKRYWPKSHMQVVRFIMRWIAEGVHVYYITGNHDEMLRKFNGFDLGTFKIRNKIVLELDGKKAWLFHGDVFDVVMQHSKWVAKLGAIGYDALILLNSFVNYLGKKFGKGPYSLSKRIKNSVKGAVKFINNFEQTAAEIAIGNSFQFVVCGHIHQPVIREISSNTGKVTYLNSGDWIENLTGLEYNNGKWSLYSYYDDPEMAETDDDVAEDDATAAMNKQQLFEELQKEFKLLS